MADLFRIIDIGTEKPVYVNSTHVVAVREITDKMLEFELSTGSIVRTDRPNSIAHIGDLDVLSSVKRRK